MTPKFTKFLDMLKKKKQEYSLYILKYSFETILNFLKFVVSLCVLKIIILKN